MVRLGTRLSIAYFDQLRAELEASATLAEAISPGSDWVQLGSERKHIVSDPGSSCSPRSARSHRLACSPAASATVSCSRAYSATCKPSRYWMSQPTTSTSNPWATEQRLQDYKGTLLLGTTTGAFSTATDYLRWPPMEMGYGASTPAVTATTCSSGRRGRSAAEMKPLTLARQASRDRSSGEKTHVKTRTRLSYKEERELAALPADIESLEREQTAATACMSAPDYHRLEASGCAAIADGSRSSKSYSWRSSRAGNCLRNSAHGPALPSS